MNKSHKNKISEGVNFVFFGSTDVSRKILDGISDDFLPGLIVTIEDKPFGRKKELRVNPVKEFAIENKIESIEPSNLSDPEFLNKLTKNKWDFFLVTSYPYIIPKEIIDVPGLGVVNVHFSLLPILKGGSPVRAAILKGHKITGTTIFLMDEKLDHGPILTQVGDINVSDKSYHELQDELIEISVSSLRKVLPKLLDESIESHEQDHSSGSYARKFKSTDGYIKSSLILNGDEEGSRKAKRKVLALSDTLGTYTIFKTLKGELRLKILSANVENNKIVPVRVVPAGKKEMSWEDFQKGNQIKVLD